VEKSHATEEPMMTTTDERTDRATSQSASDMAINNDPIIAEKS